MGARQSSTGGLAGYGGYYPALTGLPTRQPMHPMAPPCGGVPALPYLPQHNCAPFIAEESSKVVAPALCAPKAHLRWPKYQLTDEIRLSPWKTTKTFRYVDTYASTYDQPSVGHFGRIGYAPVPAVSL